MSRKTIDVPQQRPMLTPPQLARRWQCRAEKIISLIRAGELRAVNISQGATKPRYLIAEADVDAFEKSRETRPATRSANSMSRRRKQTDVVEYV